MGQVGLLMDSSNNNDSTHIFVDSIWKTAEVCFVYFISFFIKPETLSTNQLSCSPWDSQ